MTICRSGLVGALVFVSAPALAQLSARPGGATGGSGRAAPFAPFHSDTPKPPSPAPAAPASVPEPVATQAPPPPIAACPVAYPGADGRPAPMMCSCDPAALGDGAVVGTDIYGYESVPCRAARHSGAIGADGGTVLLLPLDGRQDLRASEANGISSSAGQGEGFRVYAAGPALRPYVARLQRLAEVEAHPQGVRTRDGALLPAPVSAAAPFALVAAQPVAGVTLSLPGVGHMVPPVPPLPFNTVP